MFLMNKEAIVCAQFFCKKRKGVYAMASTKKLLICTIIILAIALLAGMLPVHGESEIYDTVVRLHVLANSDDAADQALKLKVRDRVLEIVSPAVTDCKTQAEAVAAIDAIMEDIRVAATDLIFKEGYEYPVSVEIGEEYYPTTSYESCAFPEGSYISLKICIGDAAGKNWWCCLFPPLCLSAATDADEASNEDAFISVGLTGEQYKLITENRTPKYKIRFKILETLQRIFDGN